MTGTDMSRDELLAENEYLRLRLAEADEALGALGGNLDPCVDSDPDEARVFTPKGRDHERSSSERLPRTRNRVIGSGAAPAAISYRKNVELALRQSQERYRTLFNSMQEGFCIIEMLFDPEQRPVDYRILEVNPAFEDHTGLSGAQGKLARELVPDLEAYWIKAYGKVALTGEAIRVVKEVKRLGRWYEVSAYRVDGPGSHKVAVLFNDITEVKRVEAVQKDLNEELERRVADRTEQLAVTVKSLKAEIAERELAEDNLLRLNRLYLVLSETNHAIICTKDRDLLFNEFCRIAVEDGGFLLAWVGLLDQTTRAIKVAACHGAVDYLAGITITADKQRWGLGPIGSAVRGGRHVICNDFLGSRETLPWHERAQAFGVRASAGIPLRLEGEVIGALALYADEKDFFDQQQLALLKQMGADFSFALDNIHRESQREKVERALYEETSKRLRTVEALREKEQMLIQQSRQAAMGEMISNIAHQWRQPLNTLGLSIQELKMMFRFGECTEEYLNHSVAKSMELIQHMSQTIDDFRDYFKPDKVKVPFKMSDAIASTLLLIADSFKHQRVDIRVIAEGAPVVFGYRNEFSQALLNILNNARDALTEREIAEPKVTITTYSKGERAVVTIADNAGGIPEEVIGKIFDPYFTTKGQQTGTGLGLFMSKTIIEKSLGGRLTVRNAGDGAEFSIEV